MFLLAAAMALAMETPAYPIPPQTLRWLYRGADLVIVAKPGETERLEERLESWFSAKVMLTVEKTLKGKADGLQVPVYYSKGLICPEPDSYPPGKTLLVFLKWRAEIKGYHAPALSYGSKELDKDSLAVYVQRLEELAKIPAEGDDQKPSAETLDWLVRCIERRETRWEGAFEFWQGRAGRSKDSGVEPALPITLLSKEQQKRVVEVLLGTRQLGLGDEYLIRMLYDVPDDRITTFLATELRAEYFQKKLDWSCTLMIALQKRLHLEGGKELTEQYIRADDVKGSHDAVEKFLELIEKK